MVGEEQSTQPNVVTNLCRFTLAVCRCYSGKQHRENFFVCVFLFTSSDLFFFAHPSGKEPVENIWKVGQVEAC